MTAPYYTAVQTAGPVDQTASARGKLYTVVSAVLGLVAVAATFHFITTDQAASLQDVGTSLVGLVGAATTALAAFKTNKQVKNGTFEAAPVDPNAPVLNAFEQLNAIKAHVDQTVADTVSSVQVASQTIQNATSLIPGLGPIVGVGSQAVEDLLAAVGGVNRK